MSDSMDILIAGSDYSVDNRKWVDRLLEASFTDMCFEII